MVACSYDVILSHEFSRASRIAPAPVLGLDVAFKAGKLPQLFHPVDNHLPGTIDGGVNLARAVPGSPAGTVQQLLGTAGYGTHAAKEGELAITAPQAFLGEQAVLFKNAD